MIPHLRSDQLVVCRSIELGNGQVNGVVTETGAI
jgi:hypothetical protein